MAGQLKTIRGVLFFVIGLIVLCSWMGSSIYLNHLSPPPDPTAARAAAPSVILLLCLMNLLLSTGERAVNFTPAEVDFLFPGPYSRRQLLTFKLIKTAFATVLSALIFAVVTARLGGAYACRLVGIWLLFQFFQLLAMTIALLQASLGERFMSLGRRWAIAIVIVAVGLATLEIYRNHHSLSLGLLLASKDTLAGQIILTPFKIFAFAIFASSFWTGGLGWAALALLIDLCLVVVVLGLDANYLDTAATASARRYDRLARVRRAGIGGMANPSSSRLKIPMLPQLAGAGSIIWRQATTALRTARTFLTILLILAIGSAVMLGRTSGDKGSIVFIAGSCVYINLFLSQALKFDFRGDLDHLDLLRSLPLRPWIIAFAQLVAPAGILLILQISMIATLAIMGRGPANYLVILVAFSIPLAMLTLGVDNFFFLLFPIRAKAAVAGDMALVGRQSILFACRFTVILVAAMVAAGVGGAVWWMTNHSLLLTAVAAWLPLLGIVTMLIWLTGAVFNRFDPSTSTPS